MTSQRSLYRYLLTRILFLVVPIAVAGVVAHWIFERRLLVSQFDESLARKASVLATLVTRTDDRLELEFADEFMPEFSSDEHPHVFQVWYPDGRVLERSFSLGEENLPFEHGPLAAPSAFEARLASGVDLRCVGIEFPARLGFAGHAGSSVIIAVGAPAEQLNAKLQQGYLEVALTGAVSVAGIAILVLVVLRHGVRSLDRIVKEVERITPGSLEKPLDEVEVPVEVRPIVAALNRSMATLHGYVEREKRFTADVAHELRTPIAELRAAADVALRWPDDESHRRLAEDARDIALQMGSLVESLLELAVLESDAPQGTVEEMDLVEVVERLVDHASRDGQRSITIEAPESLRIASRARLWEVAIRNLIDNALSYSPEQSRVHVQFRADGDGVDLCISNPTDQLAPGDVARCTDRLWRAKRDQHELRHFGLGLSIVQAACAKLGHRLEVRLEDGVFHASIRRQGPPRAPPDQPAVHQES